MDITIIVSAIGCMVGLICSALVTWSVMQNINKIGDLPRIKQQAISRTLFNFYAILALSFVILVRALNFIETQLFIAFFVAILGGLGVKVSFELKDHSNSQDATQEKGGETQKI